MTLQNDCSCFETNICSCDTDNCVCECSCDSCDAIMMDNIDNALSMEGCPCGGNCGCNSSSSEESIIIDDEDKPRQC